MLRLLETFEHRRSPCRREDRPCELGAIGFDAVKHLVLCQVERRPPKLDLDVYPYLPRAPCRDHLGGQLHVPAVGDAA